MQRPRYEFRRILDDKDDDGATLLDVLNAAGSEGWDIAAFAFKPGTHLQIGAMAKSNPPVAVYMLRRELGPKAVGT